MRIGLIAVDSDHPNLALMKISGWHKSRGDEVEWFSPLFDYDIVYMSKIFSFKPDYPYPVNCDDVRRGGTGYDVHKVRWIYVIRFGCDTPAQVVHCERAMSLIDKYRKNPASYLLYTMIHGDIKENYERLAHFRDFKRVRIVAQPFRDLDNPNQVIPQWQKDMARWAMRRELYASTDFKDFRPRKGFVCSYYF